MGMQILTTTTTTTETPVPEMNANTNYISLALTCNSPTCHRIINSIITKPLFYTDLNLKIYNPHRNLPFFNPNCDANASDGMTATMPLTPAQRERYRQWIRGNMALDTNPDNYTNEDGAAGAFAQYRVDYHVYLHYLCAVHGVLLSRGAEEMEVRRWRWRVDLGQAQGEVMDSWTGRERKGAISLQGGRGRFLFDGINLRKGM